MTAEAVAGAGWSREQDKAFEDALAEALPFDEGDEGGDDERRWEEIAAKVPGRTGAEVRRHYEVLVEDVRSIEGGRVPPPCYVVGAGKDVNYREGEREQQPSGPGVNYKKAGGGGALGGGSAGASGGAGFDSPGGGQGRGGGGSKAEQERRKGIPWTEEEHKLFLLGLDKFGKGDWRSISRNFVMSRTPTQVASHAQKYFIRLNSINRDRRRASIHDITACSAVAAAGVSSPAAAMAAAAPAIGVVGAPPPHSLVKHPAAGLHGHPPPMPPPGMMAVYAAPPVVGQPAAAHMAASPAAVGTPVMRPPAPGHPSPYVIPLAYPMPPPAMRP